MLWVACIFSLLYISLIGYFFYGWLRSKQAVISKDTSIFISVLIPMRNEEDNIIRLLDDLQNQTYPGSHFEIVVVDDHSTDNSLARVRQFENVIILELQSSESGKKAALRYAMQHANGQLIVMTDADCRVGSQWLSAYASFYIQTQAAMILAPVLAVGNGWRGCMLMLEQMSLIGSTAGAAAIKHPIMSNGANIAIAKEYVPHIQDIYQNKHIRSGDDMFAMMKMHKRFPGKVMYLKSTHAIVNTTLPKTFMLFIKQRRRWAAKARFYKDAWVLFTALSVFLTNLVLFFALLWGICLAQWLPVSILFTSKCLIDFFFLKDVTSFFNQKRLLWGFLPVQSFYFLYVVFTAVTSLIPVNNWKGRKIKH